MQRKYILSRELNNVCTCMCMCVLLGGKKLKLQEEGRSPVEVEKVKETQFSCIPNILNNAE